MIIGHQKIINFLDKSIEREKISGAYLFCGPENAGKFTVALDFANKITGGNNQAVNPDIIIIAPEVEEKKGVVKKKDIKIEQIRDLQHSLSLSSYLGKYKVAIINDADFLTVSAQNALLKILEEPPENCVLILISHNREKIISTVQSRCLIKNFNLTADDMKKTTLAERNELKNIFEANLNDKFILAEKLSKNVPELILKLGLWSILLRENIFKENFLNINPEKSLEVIEKTLKSAELIKETNSNPRLVLENLFLNF